MKIVNNNERLNKLESVGIVLRPSTPQLKQHYLNIKSIFEARGIKVYIDSLSAGMIGVMGQDFDTLCKESDVLISIGGDGTLISVARRSYFSYKPILAISAGKLGFLTDINLSEASAFIDKLFDGMYRIDFRMMMQIELIQKNGTKNLVSFNDIVITRKTISNMINIEVCVTDNSHRYNDTFLSKYYGDGLIVSTPTGSTAYNLSAQGPVLFPLTQAFIITPICPHSLTQRPIVLPSDFEIALTTLDSEGAIIIVDGQEIYEFNIDDKIVVRVANEPVRLLHRVERNYFDILREKLSWGDR